MSESVVTETNGFRHLYVPSREISWSAQVDRGVRLAGSGQPVRVHRHGYGSSCVLQGVEIEDGITPSEWCVEISLQDGQDTVSVLPVSNTESETTKTA
jgi:hypothetical protein